MKTTKNILIVLFSILLISCKSNPTNENVSQTVTLSGEWLLTEYSGGISGGTHIPPENQKYVVQFTVDSNYYEYLNDTLISSTHYSIQKKYAPGIFPNIDSVDAIVWQNQSYFSLIRILTKDSLCFWDMCADCFTHNYIKLSQ